MSIQPLSSERLAETAIEMRRILARQPQLGAFGFGVFDPRRKSVTVQDAELVDSRDRILTPEALAAFVATRAWLQQHDKRKTINKRGTSYGLKHVVENDIGYITNGVFIAAAIAEGFRVVRIGDTPNAWLNIATTAWDKGLRYG